MSVHGTVITSDSYLPCESTVHVAVMGVMVKRTRILVVLPFKVIDCAQMMFVSHDVYFH